MPATSERFEPLPAFTPLNFSLTDGTGIPPPPPDSPIEEQAPPPPSKPSPAPTPAPVQTQQPSNGSADSARGVKRAHDDPPQSPATSMRPSSIRRFLSRKSLNANYTNGTNHNVSSEDLSRLDRPDSPSSFFTSGGAKPKRTSSWFKRLGNSNRSSLILEKLPEETPVVPMGPPPPKLPELNQLKASIPDNDEGSLGGADLFKNIN